MYSSIYEAVEIKLRFHTVACLLPVITVQHGRQLFKSVLLCAV